MGLVSGLERCGRAVVVYLDQEKPVLGGTCSRLAYTKQGVASSNTNIYDRKYTFFDPGGSSLARPGPSPARGQILEIWVPGNPGIWNSKNQKNKNIKMQIRSAKNVGKVWISRNRASRVPFGAI